MKVNYNIDMEDFMSFQKYYLSTSKNFFKVKLLNSLIFPIFLIILIGVFSYLKGINYNLIIISILGVCLIFLTQYKHFAKHYLAQMRKEYEKSDMKNILGSITMEVNDENIIIKMNGNEEKIQWGSLYKLTSYENYFYLFTSNFSAHIIPKKKISNIEGGSLEEFFEYIQTHSKKSIS